MSIRATCSCGKAFLANSDLAGKVVKCPACGGAFRVPLPAAAAPADNDPLGLNDLSHTDFGPLPAATPSHSVLSAPAARTAPRPKQPAGGGFPPALKIGLIVGGAVLAGVVGLVVLLALLLPAVQAAREAARKAAARSAGALPSGGKWQTFTSASGGYSISMPGMPQLRSQPAPSAAGLVTVQMAIVDRNREGAYFASHIDAPPGGYWQVSLDACLQEMLRSMQGQMVASRNFSVAGNPVCESDVEGTKDGQAFCGRIQLFRAGATQYQLMWIGPKGKKPESDLQQFFSSFQLTRAATPATTPPPVPPAMPPVSPLPGLTPPGSAAPFSPAPVPPAMPPGTPPPSTTLPGSASPFSPPPTPPVMPPGSPPPGLTPPGAASPFSRTPAKPGELTDAQRKSIYQALASYERASEMSARRADELDQAGQREAAARIRQSREEARQGLVRTIARVNGISEAQVEEIYQTGKRETWDR